MAGDHRSRLAVARAERRKEQEKRKEQAWRPAWPAAVAPPGGSSPSRSPPPSTAALERRRRRERNESPHWNPREVGVLASGLGSGPRTTEEEVFTSEYGGRFGREPTPPRSASPRLPPEELPAAGKPSGFYERFQKSSSPRGHPCPRGGNCPYPSCPLQHPKGRFCPRGEGCMNPNCGFVHPQDWPLSPRHLDSSAPGTPVQYIQTPVGQFAPNQTPPLRFTSADLSDRGASPDSHATTPAGRHRSPDIPIVDAVGSRVLLTSRDMWAEDFVSLWEQWAEATSNALRDGGEVPAPPAPPALPRGNDAEVPPHLLARLTEAATFAAAFLAKGAANNKELRQTAGELEEELHHTKEDRQRLEDLVHLLSSTPEGRKVFGVPFWTPPAAGGDTTPPHDTGSPFAATRQIEMTPQHENRLREIVQGRSASSSPDPPPDRREVGHGAPAGKCNTCGNTFLEDEAFCRRCGTRRLREMPPSYSWMEGDGNKLPRELQRLQAALRDTETDKLELMDELRRLQIHGQNPQMRAGAAQSLERFAPRGERFPGYDGPQADELPAGWGAGDDDERRPRRPPPKSVLTAPQRARRRPYDDEESEAPQRARRRPYDDEESEAPQRARRRPYDDEELVGARPKPPSPPRDERAGFRFSDDLDDEGPAAAVRAARQFGRGLSFESLSSDSSEEDLLLASRGNTKGNFNSRGGVMTALRRFDQTIVDLCHILGGAGAQTSSKARTKEMQRQARRHLREHELDDAKRKEAEAARLRSEPPDQGQLQTGGSSGSMPPSKGLQSVPHLRQGGLRAEMRRAAAQKLHSEMDRNDDKFVDADELYGYMYPSPDDDGAYRGRAHGGPGNDIDPHNDEEGFDRILGSRGAGGSPRSRDPRDPPRALSDQAAAARAAEYRRQQLWNKQSRVEEKPGSQARNALR